MLAGQNKFVYFSEEMLLQTVDDSLLQYMPLVCGVMCM